MLFRLSVDVNSSFVALKPLDGSGDASGAFACNREESRYEEKKVVVPAELACTECVLQFEWTTANGSYYSCADVTVLHNQTKECAAQCLNGGACVDGVCLCVKPYYGEFCEVKSNGKALTVEEEKERSFVWLLLALLVTLLLALGIGAVALPKSSDETKRLIHDDVSVQHLGHEPVVEREAGRRARGYVGNACPQGHRLVFTKDSGDHLNGRFVCANCKEEGRCGDGRWTCNSCPIDYCSNCKPFLPDQGDVREENKSAIPEAANVAPDAPIMRVVGSDQVESVPEHKSKSSAGKAVWVKTHFIFMIDCSISMKGSRWESVRAGFNDCLEKLRPMKEVVVTGLTFDNKPNVFCREKTPDQAIRSAREMVFTGTGTNYKRCLEYALGAITKGTHPDYLFCLMLLSDGLGGYPDRAIEEIKELRREGMKILFYSIACETEDDVDMMQIAIGLEGEHFKVNGAQGMKGAFTRILGV